MQSAPDISKIISVIMQNPTLISEIAALANQSTASEPKGEDEPVNEGKETASEVVSAPSEARVVSDSPVPKKRAHRKELLNAMKPYLSETRRGALDSVASILDILDVMMRKET